LDFLKPKDASEEEGDDDAKVELTQKTFPVIAEGEFWEVQVSPCHDFLAALENSGNAIFIDCRTR
jgi:hypothetical protein